MGTEIKIATILIDNATHPRDSIDKEVVSEYADLMQAGTKFPLIVIFNDGSKNHLGDGRHRLEAYKKLGHKTIKADVRKGSKRDAILFAVGANNEHGLRRSNEDKHKAVRILLVDQEWRKWADREIGRRCNVSWRIVTSVREELKSEKPHLSHVTDSDERLVERGGTTFTQKTGDIGKPKEAEIPTAGNALSEIITLASEASVRLIAEDKPKLVAKVDKISLELQEILGQATGANYRMEDLEQPINVYERPRGDGVKPNPEFAKKCLCTYSVGIGFSCGHQCTYCSTPSSIRTLDVYSKDIKLTAFVRGYAVLDPDSAKRIKDNMPKNLTKDDVIQLSTIDDAWSPEARRYNLGHKVMEVMLEETPAQIRVLTKSAEVAKDFKMFAKYGKRVIVGLSTGIPPNREDVAKVVEPNASPIKDRLAALRKAHEMGLRTFGMLCPCLPLVADTSDALNILFDSVLECGAEDIWLEPINARGKSLTNTVAALKRAGLASEAEAVNKIRKRSDWSKYTVNLIETAIDVAKSKKALNKLHILLYPTGLAKQDLNKLKKQPAGIIWL